MGTEADHRGPIGTKHLELQVNSNGVAVFKSRHSMDQTVGSVNDCAVFTDSLTFAAWCKTWYEQHLGYKVADATEQKRKRQP